MVMDWAIVFQGVSAAAAVVQAVKAALKNPEVTKEKLCEIAAKAEEKAKSDISNETADRARQQITTALDDETIDVVNKKIKEINKTLNKELLDSVNQADWVRAADEARSDICAILRTIKQLNGGKLVDEWYKIWVDHNCT